jgi:hypothetical protein
LSHAGLHLRATELESCLLLPRLPLQITENFSYLPFGGGRRKCIGDQFALFEALVALAVLVRTYDFSLAPGKPEVGMTTGEEEGQEGAGSRGQQLHGKPAALQAGAQQVGGWVNVCDWQGTKSCMLVHVWPCSW